MEAELRYFQATVFPYGEAESRHFRAPSHTFLYAEAELRNFKSQYIPCAEVELQAKDYPMCGSGTADMATSNHIIVCVRKQNCKSQDSLYVDFLWFLMQESEMHESAGLKTTVSKPSWRCCSQLCHLGGGPYWDCFSLLRSYQA